MSRAQIPVAIIESRVVVVARRLSRVEIEALVALGPIGSIVFEVTLDGKSAIDDIRWLTEIGVVAGAGTVTEFDHARTAVDAGAQFLVSPYLDEGIVTWAANAGVPMVPGAFTPTEIVRAWDVGAAAIKVFPASVAGPQLLRELRGPLGHIPLMPTGGISSSNATSFLDAGAFAVGVGGWLTGATGADLASRWADLRKAAQ